MNGDLSDGWHSREDRKIMVRSLAKFSSECEAPELTPECPYYEISTKGQPVCGEQCIDLLARYPEDHVQNEPFYVGAGLAALRQRPRRGPATGQPAYDARQQRMVDRDKSLSDWHISSLLQELAARAFVSTETDASIDSADLIKEVGRRGLVDAPTTLTFALAPTRLVSLTLQLLSETHEDMTDVTNAEINSIPGHLDEWRRVLNDVDGLHEHEGHTFLSPRGRSAVVGWYHTSGIETVLSDAVPSTAELEAGLDVMSDADAVASALWMMDRFTHTYETDWRPQSRIQEWRYSTGQRTGCAPPGVMRSRPVDPDGLARILAGDRCDAATAQDDESEGPKWTPAEFKTIAIGRLIEGRPDQAVHIFRVLADMRPDDAETRNDLGFCLIPFAPKESVELFRSTIDQGAPVPTLTQFNLALALHLSDDHESGLRVAAAALEDATNGPAPSWVWTPTAGSLEFVMTMSLPDYGEKLFEHMASCPGSCVEARLI